MRVNSRRKNCTIYDKNYPNDIIQLLSNARDFNNLTLTKIVMYLNWHISQFR